MDIPQEFKHVSKRIVTAGNGNCGFLHAVKKRNAFAQSFTMPLTSLYPGHWDKPGARES